MMLYPDVLKDVESILWPKPLKLFTAGPVACFPEVLEAMKFQMLSHRSDEYRAIHRDTVQRLADFLDARHSTVLLFPSSGTGFMEASIRNAVSPGGKVLVTIIGEFGQRYKEAVERNGRTPVVLEKPLGKPVLPNELDEALKKSPDVEAVAITHNETSTGVINPLKELAKVVKEREKLLFVDAVSSMGAADIRVDEWGIDLVFASSQKAFGVPPGLSMATVSEAVFNRAKVIPERGLYFDLLEIQHYLKTQWSTPTTPPVPQVVGLNVALRIVEKMGGRDKWLKMYSERAEKIRGGATDLGLQLFAEPGYYSPTITVVYNPPGIKGSVIYDEMRKRGIEIARGYGKVRDVTFRIGHMGYITDEDIASLFSTLREVLASIGYKPHS
ncbi:MAG: alanine--glyoxylate aminotransferase family protein [Desulfurococcaceae archaeon]